MPTFHFITLQWQGDDENGALFLIDQTQLPGKQSIITCQTLHEVAHAISTLQVRGAPAIGVAAAYGMALGSREAVRNFNTPAGIREAMQRLAHELNKTRPTAVNLSWAIDGALKAMEDHFINDGECRQLPAAILKKAHEMHQADRDACEKMGEYGAPLIADNATVLTHCNAGALATAGIGTALAPIYIAAQSGKHIHVFVDETRPVLQGARLTAWELQQQGIPATLITDNMAAYHMRHRSIQAIFVGADRIAANGDTANKIGTYGLAIIASYHHVPFYVVAPISTIDFHIANGAGIPIEERNHAEVTHVQGQMIAPAGIHVSNPAFDVTPADLISAIITERGIIRPPFDQLLPTIAADASKHS